MQVSVENTSALERKMTVAVPAERVDNEVKNRLRSMAPKVKLAGFRPGKVPFKLVEKRYGQQVRGEVIGELVSSSFYEAVEQEKLRPAGMPKIETTRADAGEDLEFTATFEVYPEFEVQGVEDIAVERPVAEITEADVDAMIDRLRQQRVQWQETERPAQDGDRVTVDFDGRMEGEPFEGGSGEDMTVVLGSGRMIEGFEEALVGAKAGDTVTAELSFPEDYHKEELAGKPVTFTLEVKKVEEPVLPELDDAFAASYGIEEGGMEAFRKDVRANMQRELDAALKSQLKKQVMDGLLEKNTFEIPQSMIQAEAGRIAQQMNEQMRMRGGQLAEEMMFKPEQFLDEGRRRVALGLILGELIRQHEMKADPERVRAEVEKTAAAYDEPEEVVKWYYGDAERLGEVESMVLEDQVVDWVLERAQVTDKPMSFSEVVESQRS